MDSHRQSTIVYAVGFLEDYVEAKTEPVEAHPDDSEDEKYGAHLIEENEHREQVRAMMKIISDGVMQLCRENSTLLNKIYLAESALKG